MKEFKLENEPKITTGFKAPDTYFDTLQAKINQRIPEKETKVIPLLSRKRTWILAVAAVFIIGLSIPLFDYFNDPVSDIDNASIENYLVNHAAVSDDDIVELLNEADIQQIKINISIDEKELEDVLTANSNLEEYIN